MVSTNGGLSFYNLNDSIFYVLKVIFSDLRVISNIIGLYKSSGRDCLLEAKLRIKFLTDKYLRVKMQSLRDLFGWGVLFPTHRRFGFASRLYVVNRPLSRSATRVVWEVVDYWTNWTNWTN